MLEVGFFFFLLFPLIFCSILIFSEVFKMTTYLFCPKENQGRKYCSHLDQSLVPSIIQIGTAQIFPREDENGGEIIRVICLASPPRDFPSRIFTERTSEGFVFQLLQEKRCDTAS